jgi:hypothetical protein
MGPVGDILGIGASLADTTATDNYNLAFAPAPTSPTDALDTLTQGLFGEYVSAQQLAVL